MYQRFSLSLGKHWRNESRHKAQGQYDEDQYVHFLLFLYHLQYQQHDGRQDAGKGKHRETQLQPSAVCLDCQLREKPRQHAQAKRQYVVLKLLFHSPIIPAVCNDRRLFLFTGQENEFSCPVVPTQIGMSLHVVILLNYERDVASTPFLKSVVHIIIALNTAYRLSLLPRPQLKELSRQLWFFST